MKTKLTRVFRMGFVLLILNFTFISVIAQAPIKGRVTTPDGKPVVGVSVVEKNTKNGTSTNLNGEFSLQASGSSPMLVFSNVGFITQELASNGQSTLEVTLAEDKKELSEVVVTAMGVKKEAKRLGYSVQEVKGA